MEGLSIERVKEKIQKLFAMTAEAGASQQEVETAIKKAQKLMVQYKLSEKDVMPADKNPEAIIKYFRDIQFTAQVDYWVLTLMKAVAKNFRCEDVTLRVTTRTRVAGFIGEPEDVEIAGQVLTAAYGLAKETHKKIASEARKKKMSAAQITSMCNAYGGGFARGLREALAEQVINEEAGFALAIQVPAHVSEFTTKTCKKISLGSGNASSKANQYGDYRAKGYTDGKAFTARKAIA